MAAAAMHSSPAAAQASAGACSWGRASPSASFGDCPRHGANFDSSADRRRPALASCSGRGIVIGIRAGFEASGGLGRNGAGAGAGAGGGGGRESWSLALPRPSTAVQKRRQGRVRFSSQRGVDPREQDKEVTVREIAELAGSLVSLKRLIGSGYRAIGPEMRDRVDRLYDRVMILQESANRAVTNQLTATLRALQRDHGSLENIIRLAMEAEPTLANFDSAGVDSGMPKDVENNIQLEDLKPKASIFQSLIRQSAVEPLSTSTRYVMTSPASQGSSPLAAFRAEIERRVMKQLSEKRNMAPVKSSTDISTEKAPLPKKAESQGFEKLSSQDPIREEKKEDKKNYSDNNFDSDIQQETPTNGSGLSSSNLMAKVEDVLSSTETESLKRNMSTIRQELQGLQQVNMRADMAENKIQQLEVDLAKTIPLELHEQMVRNIRTSLTDARVKVLQVTGEVREKEAMLEAVKKSMLAEQDKLVNRVRQLTGDLARKVSPEEMEAAVSYAVGEVEKELERVQQRAISLSLELEKKERFLVQQQNEWLILREGLESELASVKQRLEAVNRKRAAERAELIEAQEKVKVLEKEVVRLQESEDEAQSLRLKTKKETLATVRVLISHMVQSARAKAKSDEQAVSLVQEVAKLQEEKTALELVKKAAEEKAELAEAEMEGMRSSLVTVGKEVETLQGALVPTQKTAALENFFAAMAQLIKKEDERMNSPPYNFLQIDSFGRRRNLEDVSRTGDDGQEVKNMVTLQYESSWEWAYLHFKADDSGWTEVPGVLMQNDGSGPETHLKVLVIQASSVEFVLNDGKGSWDSAPGGGNYFIRESGNYYLSAGNLKKIE
ncbi:hypothetical protein MPTK1_1g26860 [Marchantia polymorpha subsp. ruderalis]|uniref:Carbohydrate binding module family 25 domain-containing protein n=2 Tax=Marchantia polymorpha TaxID=3197 RepID=A0AAF6AUN7_MARPO|nr:hypothetical protein MARPO_0002s0192 [Marchantia polymorpha]BBN00158.1 hypothetical protein Mp_1g26860 [Marchantia polymorpha subsp. ruderalis]|eukprot:PTQ49727.1 hypothetical protein MARPO_0002s0192 [Marchantia polymorpha]